MLTLLIQKLRPPKRSLSLTSRAENGKLAWIAGSGDHARLAPPEGRAKMFCRVEKHEKSLPHRVGIGYNCKQHLLENLFV